MRRFSKFLNDFADILDDETFRKADKYAQEETKEIMKVIQNEYPDGFSKREGLIDIKRKLSRGIEDDIFELFFDDIKKEHRGDEFEDFVAELADEIIFTAVRRLSR